MADIYQNRWEKARRAMAEAGIGSLLLVPTTDMRYMTGFRGHISDRLICLLLTMDSAFVIVPGFEKARLNRELTGKAEVISFSDGDDPYKILANLLREKGGRAAAVDNRIWGGNLLELQERLPKHRWVNAGTVITPLRMQKDEEEYRLIREAQRLAGVGLAELYQWGLKGRTEKDVAAKLTEFLTGAGLAKSSWGPIVASGPDSAVPHWTAGDRIIQKGDAVVIDFGGEYGGYQADMTRTPIVGKATDEFRRVYEVVFRANEAAFHAVKRGVPCEAVDQAARAVITQAGYGVYFTHRLGHGLGLDEHEDPYMVEGNKLPLEPGMVFSDEPGVYMDGKFGIRTEDILILKEDGPERLTDFSHDLVEID
ncbi:MAG: Xaa-Pro peptidase family protein [Treponema sp.]|nr:Xaa-Pro peptidase family protein [Treponema sp.]